MGLGSEPNIVINGCELTPSQAMTLRVAMESFAMDIAADGLGDDYHGKVMSQAYLAHVSDIRKVMYKRSEWKPG